MWQCKTVFAFGMKLSAQWILVTVYFRGKGNPNRKHYFYQVLVQITFIKHDTMFRTLMKNGSQI